MKCPHCNVSAYLKWKSIVIPRFINDETADGFELRYELCPNCNNLIVYCNYSEKCEKSMIGYYLDDVYKEELIYPKYPAPLVLSSYIPQKYVDLYKESEQVNNISPRASATLSRYLLQMILHEELKISKRNLEDEIEELETISNVPSNLIALLQVMRRVANFGAHPKKSTNSAEIVDVEKGESSVMLELIREVFDYVFVKPAQHEEFLKDIEKKYGINNEP